MVQPAQLRDLRAAEKKHYSQHGEDGITDYIFSRIGATNKCFVDLGIGTGHHSNTPWLAVQHGWHGLAVDRDPSYVEAATALFARDMGDRANEIKVIHALLTMENVNGIVGKAGVSGEIDFLSIDVDGNDYWLWEALDVITPRVVCIEYNSLLDPQPVTIAYRPDFRHTDYPTPHVYLGASLSALMILAHKKGYILVGAERSGTNAFFVGEEAAAGVFEDMTFEQAFVHSGSKRGHKQITTTTEQRPLVWVGDCECGISSTCVPESQTDSGKFT